MFHGVDLLSVKKYFKVVHTTKNNTPNYSYKKKKSTDSNVTGDLPDESSTKYEEKAVEGILFLEANIRRSGRYMTRNIYDPPI